jgi:acetylornithine deacetylase/succinyl-diaminopimelate desuccinylase-like protein
VTGAIDAAAIDAAWEERILPTLCEYTRIPCLSPAYDPDWAERGAVAEAAELLLAWVRDQDPALHAEIVRLPGRTPVLLVDNGGSGDPVVVYGHMDKQPPLGEWRSGLGPYEPVREGDVLYGRGTADDGYSTFAAVTGLLAAGGGHGRVLILIEASEESGSPDLAAHLVNLRERIGTPRLVICLDSGGLSYDRLWLTTSLRGVLVADVRVDVLTEGIHSGQGGGVVPSSFRILRRILSNIEDEATGRILLPELAGAGIPASHRANIEALAREFPESSAPVVEGLHLLTPDPVDRLIARTWGAALEVTGADGLPKPHDGGNVLRPSTTLKLSVRLPPDVDAQGAADALISAIRTDEGAHITIDMEAAGQGWIAPPLEPGVAATLSAVSRERFGRDFGSVGEGGSIPFLPDLQKGFPGTPFVATGVLGPHSNAHGPNEALHIPMAKAVTHAVAALLRSAG